MTTRADIVATARTALGTPWRHQGRLPKVGIDCAGLVLWVARQHGISQYEPPPYDRSAMWQEFKQYFRDNLIEIPINDMKVGDIPIFRFGVYPCHCGIMTAVGDGPRFIHSAAIRRKVVEERYTPVWKRLTVSAFRYPGLED